VIPSARSQENARLAVPKTGRAGLSPDFDEPLALYGARISGAEHRLKLKDDLKTVKKGDKSMFKARVLLMTLVGACALFVTVAGAAPAPDNQPEATAGSVFQTTLQPDLNLKTTLSSTLFPQTEVRRHGFCRCSCGYPCETSADCGGVSCDPFITCCVRGEANQSPLLGAGKSTWSGEEPVLNVKCK